jgi:predicted nucleic acid-binding protein
VAQRVVLYVELDAVPQDRDDNAILECALASKSDYIITSDKHLLRLKRYGGADIVTPAAFLTLLRQRQLDP